jgi:predicted metal-binding membrane protein
MLPATAPTIDAFATIACRRRARQEPYTPTLVFVAGYVLAWSCFSAVAAAAQWQLYRTALLTPTMQNLSPILAGVALLIAGLYQFTPVKLACMRGCRNPLSFIVAEWREGYAGALLMGLRHGLICVGCCWAVMSLMFCVSVMDLRWAAALAAYAAVEKLAPGGDTIIAPAFGSAAIVGGAALLGLSLL